MALAIRDHLSFLGRLIANGREKGDSQGYKELIILALLGKLSETFLAPELLVELTRVLVGPSLQLSYSVCSVLLLSLSFPKC